MPKRDWSNTTNHKDLSSPFFSLFLPSVQTCGKLGIILGIKSNDTKYYLFEIIMTNIYNYTLIKSKKRNF